MFARTDDVIDHANAEWHISYTLCVRSMCTMIENLLICTEVEANVHDTCSYMTLWYIVLREIVLMLHISYIYTHPCWISTLEIKVN